MRNKASNIVADYPTGQSIIVNGNNTSTAKLDTHNLAESVIGPGASIYAANPGLLVSQNPNNKNLGYSSINNQYNNQYSSQFMPQSVSVTNELTLEMENTFQKKKN